MKNNKVLLEISDENSASHRISTRNLRATKEGNCDVAVGKNMKSMNHH